MVFINGDAETAHRQTIFGLYATEMQKMRIFQNILSLTSAIGWMGGGRVHTFYRTK
jgi:hypothetical protein